MLALDAAQFVIRAGTVIAIVSQSHGVTPDCGRSGADIQFRSMNDASRWARRLGLAMSPLFGSEAIESGEHYALLDGRGASFACSEVVAQDISQEKSRDWQWSADFLITF